MANLRLTRQHLAMCGRELWSFFIEDAWIADWLFAALLIALNFTIPGYVIHPVKRPYVDTDPSLAYPTGVPLFWNETQKFTVIFLLPALVGLLMQVFKGSWHDWHHLMLSVFEGLALESTFKKWMTLVGRLRPDWLDRVKSGDADAINEGRLSYLSGHAAESFMAFSILSLYLMAQLHLFRGHRRAHFALAMLCLAPLGLAAYMSMQRFTGYRHHMSDINAGMALGLLSGVLAYFLNFPSVFAQDCDQPRMRGHAVAASAGLDAPLEWEESTQQQGRQAPAGTHAKLGQSRIGNERAGTEGGGPEGLGAPLLGVDVRQSPAGELDTNRDQEPAAAFQGEHAA